MRSYFGDTTLALGKWHQSSLWPTLSSLQKSFTTLLASSLWLNLFRISELPSTCAHLTESLAITTAIP